MDVLDGGSKLFPEVRAEDGSHGKVLLAVLGALRGLHTQHHLRVVGKIAVDGKAVGALPQLYPCWLGQVDVVPLLQNDDVCHDFRAGVGLEGVVGEPDGPQQLRPLGQILADRGILAVHGVAAGDKSHDAAGAHQIQRFCEEVVVNREAQPVIRLVVDLIIAKGHVAHGHVKEVLGIIDALVTLDGNAGVLVELLGDAPGETVQLHAVQLAVGHGFRQTAEEVAHTAGWLQNVTGLEAHVGEGVVDGPDDHRGGVMGIEGGRSCGRILVLGQQGF